MDIEGIYSKYACAGFQEIEKNLWILAKSILELHEIYAMIEDK